MYLGKRDYLYKRVKKKNYKKNRYMKKSRLMELAGLVSESDLAAYAGIGTLDRAVKDKIAYKKFIEAIDVLLDDWYAAGFTKDDIVDYMKGILPEGPGGIKEVADKRPTELEKAKYTDEEMLTRTTANQFPTNFTILDIIERYEEYVIGYLKDQGKLNETNFGPEVNPNQLASGLNSNREMEKEIVKKQARKEELMDMRVNMLRLMKSFKNLGFSEQEVAKYFEEEVKNKMKNTY
tara:strand:- start:178 stop:882 length:705 start_codon:yes stop_codon:yes gene_type:complete